MGLFNNSHTYPAPWEIVASAFIKKYPNDLQKHVKSIEPIDSDWRGDRLRLSRLMCCQYSVPSLLSRVFGDSVNVNVYEEIHVDRKNKTLNIHTSNLTHSDVCCYEEICTYFPDPDNPDQTKFTSTSKLKVNLLCLGNAVENAVMNKAKDTAWKGIQVMCQEIQKIQDNAKFLVGNPDLV